MNNHPQLRFPMVLELVLAFLFCLPLTAPAAESGTPVSPEYFSGEKRALGVDWETIDSAFSAALSVYGTPKDRIEGYVDRRATLSEQAQAWNKKVIQAGLFLPRLQFDISQDKRKVRNYWDLCDKVRDLEKASEKPMKMTEADSALLTLKDWMESGLITTGDFARVAGKVEARARENAAEICREILKKEALKAQEIFDKNTNGLKKYLSSKQFNAIRGAALGYGSRDNAVKAIESAEDNAAPTLRNPDDLVRDSTLKAQVRMKSASLAAVATQKYRDRFENDRIDFLKKTCATFERLKDPDAVVEAAQTAFGEMADHNADANDRKILEFKRDERVRQIHVEAKAAAEAEAAARVEAAKKAKAAAEAEAARQKAEEQRNLLLSKSDEEATAKRYDAAGTLLDQYVAAGGDAKIAEQKKNQIAVRRAADKEEATRALIDELKEALRRASEAKSTAAIRNEAEAINAVTAKVRQTGADSLKMSAAVTSALNRLGPLLVLAQQADSLKAAWEQAEKSFIQILSAAGASKEDIRKQTVDRTRLAQSAAAWNARAVQLKTGLPKLLFDTSADAQNAKDYLEFSAKVAILKKEAGLPMSFGKADTLLAHIRNLAKLERGKASGADQIEAEIRARIKEAAAETDSQITAVMMTDPAKAQERLDRIAVYLEKFGFSREHAALRDKIRVQARVAAANGLIKDHIVNFHAALGKEDIRGAQSVLGRLDSAVRVMTEVSAAQARPYADSLQVFRSAIEAKKAELEARAKRASDSLLALQRHRDSLRVADSTRVAEFNAAKITLYKVRRSTQIDSAMQPYLETLSRLQVEVYSPAAMKDLKAQIAERSRTLAAQEKQARADSLAKAKADSIFSAKAAAKARADSLARAKADSIATAVAAAKAKADSLAKVRAVEKASADSLAKAKADSIASEKVWAELLEKARADSIAVAKAAEKARADALAKIRADSLARAKADSIANAAVAAKAKADSIISAKVLAKAKADSLARAKADSIASAKAMAKAMADSLARVKADSIASAAAAAKALAAEKARADSLARTGGAESQRQARIDNLMANAYPTLYAIQSSAEIKKTILPLIDSMKALGVDPKDIKDFKSEVIFKKNELDSLEILAR